jgi:hypothetical protein
MEPVRDLLSACRPYSVPCKITSLTSCLYDDSTCAMILDVTLSIVPWAVWETICEGMT